MNRLYRLSIIEPFNPFLVLVSFSIPFIWIRHYPDLRATPTTRLEYAIRDGSILWMALLSVVSLVGVVIEWRGKQKFLRDISEIFSTQIALGEANAVLERLAALLKTSTHCIRTELLQRVIAHVTSISESTREDLRYLNLLPSRARIVEYFENEIDIRARAKFLQMTGLLGTFFGISIALISAVAFFAEDTKGSSYDKRGVTNFINQLLKSSTTAFWTSAAGLSGALLLNGVGQYSLLRNFKIVQTLAPKIDKWGIKWTKIDDNTVLETIQSLRTASVQLENAAKIHQSSIESLIAGLSTRLGSILATARVEIAKAVESSMDRRYIEHIDALSLTEEEMRTLRDRLEDFRDRLENFHERELKSNEAPKIDSDTLPRESSSPLIGEINNHNSDDSAARG